MKVWCFLFRKKVRGQWPKAKIAEQFARLSFYLNYLGIEVEVVGIGDADIVEFALH